jgi:hypothetical protein
MGCGVAVEDVSNLVRWLPNKFGWVLTLEIFQLLPRRPMEGILLLIESWI